MIVGAGFAGIYMLYKLLNLGLKVQVIEEGSGVGGTWYWNRYPGARCDVESMEYSYSFSKELLQDWTWSHRYSTQAEIMEYANHVVDTFGLRPYIKFNTKARSAHYDEARKEWEIKTDAGDLYRAHYNIMATGTLSSVNRPRFEGLDSFKGEWYLTGRWPKEGVDFSGKRVGIIGTGSSAVQATPVIAEQAGHLTVFQRTANYSIPARNEPLGAEEIDDIKANYPGIWARATKSRVGMGFIELGTKGALEATPEERELEFSKRWAKGGAGFGAAYTDILSNEAANETAAEYVKAKIREIVRDPITAKILSPEITLGCKRMCIDSGYYEAFNRDNVDLVDVGSAPIQRLVADGIQTTDGEYQLDIIVFAMGFDALTGALNAIDIRGRSGMALRDKWADGPRTYLGLASEGFPNMFTITGPGSPSVLSNVLRSIEHHVDWITDCITFIKNSECSEIEANFTAEDEWTQHVEDVAKDTLRYKCDSWYVGANIPGKKRVFLPYSGGLPVYREKCQDVVSKGYEGFVVS
ncbi:MAG: cyclohexanone monooxygenase [Chloroflexi bacterium]|nr:MAG: cyclohexanone monooxygenase [Chloroflexota bacterium]